MVQDIISRQNPAASSGMVDHHTHLGVPQKNALQIECRNAGGRWMRAARVFDTSPKEGVFWEGGIGGTCCGGLPKGRRAALVGE